MFSKHNDDGNRVIRFSQNGNCSFEFFYNNQKSNIILYRNYKTFNANLFKEELNYELLNTDINNAELVEITSTVLSVLDKFAPIK